MPSYVQSLIQLADYTFPSGFAIDTRTLDSTLVKADVLGVDGQRVTPGKAMAGQIDLVGQMGAGGDYGSANLVPLVTLDDFQTEVNAMFQRLAGGYALLSIGETDGATHTRSVYVQKEKFSVQHFPGYGRRVGNVKLSLVAQDPRWISSNTTTTVIGSGSANLTNNGSANTYPTFTITGPAVNPSIQIAVPGGIIKTQLTCSITALDTLVIQTDPLARAYAVQLNAIIRMDLLGPSAFSNTAGYAAFFPYLAPGTHSATVLLGGAGNSSVAYSDAWWF